MDMALVNAYILYKMVNPERCEGISSRYIFMDSIADTMMSNDWENFSVSDDGISNSRIFDELMGKRQDCATVGEGGGPKDSVSKVLVYSKDSATVECTHNAVSGLWNQRSKKKGFTCQICRFEGRGDNIVKDVCWCGKHAIRCCSVVRKNKPVKKCDGTNMTDYSWRAPDETQTCWEKAHSFYIPNGLFDDVKISQVNKFQPVFQNLRLSSEVYKKKRIAEGYDPVIKRGPRKRKEVEELTANDAQCKNASKRKRQKRSYTQENEGMGMQPPRRSGRLQEAASPKVPMTLPIRQFLSRKTKLSSFNPNDVRQSAIV